MMTRNVSILKDLIKEKKPHLSQIAASDLKLWKIDYHPADNLTSITRPTVQELGNATLLSELFLPPLDPKSVHVVVHVPDHPESRHIAGGKQEMRDMFTALDQSGCFLLSFDCP
jgi:hypothetical protein